MPDSHINTFIGGMNKDINPLFVSNKQYYDANNVRLDVNEDGTFASIINIRGTKLAFTVPNTYKDYQNNTRFTAYQYIIGYTNINSDLYIFTTGRTPGVGYLWRVNYDEITDGSPTVYIITVIPDLNINYKIKAFGRYESEKLQKIYWTDNNNYFRYINAYNPNTYAIEFDVNHVDVVPNVTLSSPILEEVTLGGNLLSGVIQYAYSLYDQYGAQTKLSPLSQLIHLTSDSEYLANSSKYKGTANLDSTSGERINTGKSVTCKIPDIDSTFDRIKVYSIHYNTITATPEINLIADDYIKESYDYSFIDSGVSLGTVTSSELKTIGGEPFKCRDFVVKDNILFPINITEDYFNPTYDARAYRFDNTREAVIKTAAGATEAVIDGINPIYPTDLTLDAVNADQDTYKYKTNGTTLGGEGENVSYTFRVEQIIIDNNGIAASPDSLNEKLYTTTSTDTITLNGISYPLKSYQGFASPFTSGLFRGGMRGEKYRVGAILINGKGQRSFVKWIGDIQFPNINDRNDVETYNNGSSQYDYSLTYLGNSNSTVYANVLGLDFTFNNLPSDVTKVEIVYVKREEKDKTILMQGLLSALIKDASSPSRMKPYDALPDKANYNSAISLFDADVFEFETPEAYYNALPTLGGLDYVDHVAKGVGSTSAYASISGGGAVRKITEIKTHGTITAPSVVSSNQILSAGQIDTLDDSDYNTFGSIRYENKTYTNDNYKSTTYIIRGTLNTNMVLKGTLANSDYIIANIYRVLDEQYGGASYEARSVNTYISTNFNNNVTAGSTTVTTFGFDTFIDYFDFYRVFNQTGTLADDVRIVYVPLETSINLSLTQGALYHRDTTIDYADIKREDEPTYYVYNKVYSKVSDFVSYFPIPANFNTVSEFPHRIKISGTKINNESVDSWLDYSVNNYHEVDGQYGDLNSVGVVNDKVYFHQEDAFGILHVNPVATTATTTGAIQLGIGDKLPYHTYIDTNTGCQDLFGHAASEKAVYWFDFKRKGIFRYAGKIEEVSRTKGLNSWFNDRYKYANNYRHADSCLIYDKKHNEIIATLNDYIYKTVEGVINPVYGKLHTFDFVDASDFTIGDYIYVLIGDDGSIIEGMVTYTSTTRIIFSTPESIDFSIYSDLTVRLRKEKTLLINESLDSIVSFADYTAPLWIKDDEDIYVMHKDTINYPNVVHVLNKGNATQIFNTYYPNEIRVFSNPKGINVYDNIFIISQFYNDDTVLDNEFFSTMRCRTIKQDSTEQSLIVETGYYTPANANVKNEEEVWKINTLLRDNSDNSRLRGKYLDTYLKYSGTNGYRFTLETMELKHRKSYR